MTDTSLDRDSLEPLLGAPEVPPLEGDDLDALFAGVGARVDAAERSPGYRLKTQPTWLRRVLGVGVFLAVVAATGLLRPRADLAELPPALLALYALCLSALVVASTVLALRPIHQPALEGPRRWVLPGVCLVTTFGLVLVPGMAEMGAPPSVGATLFHAGPCFAYGFMMGLPIYAVLRLLDRGDTLGRVHAACAAGLVGNVALELSCATGGAPHMLAGHAAVLAFYVVGVIALEWALRR